MPESIMQQFLRSSHLSGGNAAYIEDLYETYLHDPNGVPEQWRSFFDSLPSYDVDIPGLIDTKNKCSKT